MVPLLPLFILGLGLWLFALASTSGMESRGIPTGSSYRWLEESRRPSLFYRLPSPPNQDGGRFWYPPDHPAHLALFNFDPIPFNRAEAESLTLLPGIGPALAQRLVDYRRKHGPFQQKEDLLLVHGIGPKTLQRIEKLIVVP